jgi:hypothetical protein
MSIFRATQVYDNGAVYSPEILDIKQEDILKKFLEGVRNVASVSLGIKYPTVGMCSECKSSSWKMSILMSSLKCELE